MPKKRIDGSRVRMGPFSLPLYTEFLEGGELCPDWIGPPVTRKGYFTEDAEESEDEDEAMCPNVMCYVMGEEFLRNLIAFPQLYMSIRKRVAEALTHIFHEQWLQPEPAPLPPNAADFIDGPRFTPYKLLDKLYSELILDSAEDYYQEMRREERRKRRIARNSEKK